MTNNPKENCVFQFPVEMLTFINSSKTITGTNMLIGY
jgi:hypothetical protein